MTQRNNINRRQFLKTVDDTCGNGDCRAYPDFRDVIEREDIDALSPGRSDNCCNLDEILTLWGFKRAGVF